MSERPGLSHRVVLVIGLAVLLNYLDRGNLATAGPVLQDELRLSSAQLGLLLSAFFWAYAPAQLLAGWLVHKYDIRVVLATGVALWAGATTVTGLAGGFVTLLVLRLLLGLGESVTFPSWQVMVATHTSEHERGRAHGLVGSAQGVGPMLGTLAGGLAMARFGWRAMFVGLGALTFLWLWPWVSITRGASIRAPVVHEVPDVGYRAIFACRSFWGAALGHFAANYGFYFVITWLPTFLVKAGGFSVSEMSGIAAGIYGIYAASTAVSGVVSDRWIRRGASATRVRKTFALTAGLGSAVAIATCGVVDPRHAVPLLAVAGVFFGLSTPMIFAMAATLAGPRAAGRWAGAQNLAGQVAGIVAPLVTGMLVDRTGTFALAFAAAAASGLVAMVAWGLVVGRIEPTRWPGDVPSVAAIP